MARPPSQHIRLSVDLWVHDPERLQEFAARMYAGAWESNLAEDAPDADLGTYLYEALIASNGTPESPIAYGVELQSYTWHLLEDEP